MNEYEWNKRWEALGEALKPLWGKDFARHAYRAMEVYKRLPAELQHQLLNAPQSTQVALANGYCRAGTPGAMPVDELILATEQLINPQSRYHNRRDSSQEEMELHETAKELITDFFNQSPGGDQLADPTEPGPPVGAEPTPEAKAEARKLMDTKGPFFSKAHPDHEAVRARVQGLLSGEITPQAPAQTTPQTPAAGQGQTGEEDHA